MLRNSIDVADREISDLSQHERDRTFLESAIVGTSFPIPTQTTDAAIQVELQALLEEVDPPFIEVVRKGNRKRENKISTIV